MPVKTQDADMSKYLFGVLVVILLSGIMLSVDSCPTEVPCKCSDSGKWTKVDCSKLGLREIPRGIPQNTYYLWVVFLYFTFIRVKGWSFLRNINNVVLLRFICLDQCSGLWLIAPTIYRNLRGNNLKHIPTKVLKNLTMLYVL